MITKQIELKDYPELKIAHDFVNKVPNAVIAGGVARDILLNGQLSDDSDIDIFIGKTNQCEPSLLLDVFNICTNLKKKPRIVESYSGSNEVRINADNLDIILLEYISDGATELVSRFDMVFSQAWLAPICGGFEVYATNLFHELNQRKILGYYPELCRSPSKHVSHIAERFPNYMLLALSVPTRDCVDSFINNDPPFLA